MGDFPVSEDGILHRERHLHWIATMKQLEHRQQQHQQQANMESIDQTLEAVVVPKELISVPSREDFLFGRGKPIQENPGNLRLHFISESFSLRYNDSRKSEKTVLAQEVVLKIKSTGGRFLKQAQGTGLCWEQVGDDVAREKVSHTFRSLRQLKIIKEKKVAAEGTKKRPREDVTRRKPSI
jgi:hypothetical protein